MFLSELSEFPSAPCLPGEKNLMTARVSMLLKSRASLTCFRACFLPGRAKDLSAPRYVIRHSVHRGDDHGWTVDSYPAMLKWYVVGTYLESLPKWQRKWVSTNLRISEKLGEIEQGRSRIQRYAAAWVVTKLPLWRIRIFGSSQIRRYLRYHEGKMAIRLAHGATQLRVSNGTPHAEDDTVKTYLRLAIRCDDN